MIRALWLLALWPATAGAALAHDPWAAWTTFSSEHFDVHAHQGVTQLAPRVASICESEYSRLRQLFKFEPSSRVDVILSDESDEANGSSTPFPRNETIFLVAPFDAVQDADDLDDWLRYLASHELTHIFHLDHTRAFPHFLHKVFGRLPFFYPNLFQPPWVLEGLATWSETIPESRVGRGQSSFFRAEMRLELEHGLKPLRQVNQPVEAWPAGNTRYLYGVFFMEFLRDHYGKIGIRRWVENYSDDWVPFFFNRNAKKTFHKNMPALWKDFEVWLNEEFSPEIESVKKAGIRGEAVASPPTGSYNWGPMKGDFAVRDDGDGPMRLQKLEDGRWKDIADMNSSRFCPGDGRVLLIESGVIHQARWSTDLFELDLKRGCKRRLTRGLRIREAVYMKGGIVVVAGDAGQKRLLRLDGDGRILGTLWQGQEGENPSTLSASPDGSRLLASLWRETRGWDLVEFNFEKRAWDDLVARPENEISPAWSADGSEVFFSADYGRIFNIWKLDLQSREITQVTNVLGAAMYPNPRDNHTLDFSLLTASGFERGELDLGQALGLTPPAQPLAAEPVPAVAPVTVTSSPYSPWPSLWPTWWLPWADVEEAGSYFGFAVSNSDLLQRHQASLLVLGGLAPVTDVFGSASYAYQRYVLQPSVLLSRYPSAEADSQGGELHERVNEQWSAALSLPWSTAWRAFELQASASGRRAWDYWRGLTATPQDEIRETLFEVAAAYDSTQSYSHSIGPSGGLAAALGYARLDPGLDNDASWIAWSLSRPTALGGLNILELSASGGAVQSGSEIFDLSQLRPRWAPKEAFRPDARLQGYQSGLPELQGNSAATAHLGWRFPIVDIERGWMAPPLGIDKLFGRAFVESAKAGNSWSGDWNARSSVGLELDSILVFGYDYSFPLDVGWAHGVDEGGKDQFYLSLDGATF